MLDSMRRGAKSPIAKVLFFLLVASFAVWGIGDIFRGTTANDVAKVGDETIPGVAFEQEFRLTVERLSQQSGGQIDAIRARQMGFADQVLVGMVQRKALQLHTEELGLTVSDQRLSDEIVSTPAFSSATGNFNEQTYDELLRRNGLTRAGYEASLRQDLARQQLIDALTSGARSSRKMAEAIFNFRNERRVVEYVVVPPEQAGEIAEPTESELKAFYDENLALFFAPEFRTFNYIRIEPGDLSAEVEIDEETVDATYEFDRSRFETPERRTVQVIPFFDEEEAQAAAAKLEQEGFSFDGLVADSGFDIDEITQTDITEFEMSDALIAKAAFALEKDAISPATNGQLGWAIMRVTSITPAVEQSAEDAKAAIREELTLEAAKDLLFETIGILDDELAGGATLEEAAEIVNVPVVIVASTDREGNAPDGEERRIIPSDLPGLITNVFSDEEGVTSELLDTPTGGIYAYRVDSIEEAKPKPYDLAKDDVKSIYLTNTRSEKLAAFAEDMVGRAKTGADFEALAGEIGRTILTTTPAMARNYSSDIFSAATTSTLFSLEQGGYHFAPVNLGESYVVARVKEIVSPDLTQEAIQVSLFRDQLTQSLNRDIADQYVAALQDQYDVKIYPEMVDTILGPLPN